MEKIIGYTAGTYDLFHKGHLNLFKNAKKHCDILIVGVNTDELVGTYKTRTPIIPFEDRLEIVSSINYVDRAEPGTTLDRLKPALEHGAKVVFIGSDWKTSERWIENEKILASNGIKTVFLDYTENVSTTEILSKIEDRIKTKYGIK